LNVKTHLDWIKRAEIHHGIRSDFSTDERERIKAMEREIKELRRADEILKSASAFLAKLRYRLFSPKRRSTAN